MQLTSGPKPVLPPSPRSITVQAPATHDRPAPQTFPHAPQWAVLLVVSVSQPLTALPSQSPRPLAHESEHRPALHAATPPSPAGTQVLLHRPQWVALVLRFTSQPLVALPSQSPKPARHATVHAPEAQRPSAPGAPGQAVTLSDIPSREHRRTLVALAHDTAPGTHAVGTQALSRQVCPMGQSEGLTHATQRPLAVLQTCPGHWLFEVHGPIAVTHDPA
jgi:hypothetical protein